MQQDKLHKFKSHVLNQLNRFFKYKHISSKTKMGIKFKKYLDTPNTGISYNFYLKRFYKKTNGVKTICTIEEVIDILAPIYYVRKYCHSKRYI